MTFLDALLAFLVIAAPTVVVTLAINWIGNKGAW